MIRYEYDDDFSQDHPLPVIKCETNEVKQEIPSDLPEGDWVNSVDPFYSEFNSRDSFEHFNSDLGSFAQDDFHGLEVYVDGYQSHGVLHNFDEPNAFFDTSAQVKQEPLRTRDTNAVLCEPSKPKKKIKQPCTRRPIDEFQTKNGFKKPNFSYSCLIGLALKNSRGGELTVAEIYRFLCEYFPFFREAPSGWKNSVRHNLSLNKCFEKVEVEVPDAQGRKSRLWKLNPLRADKMAAEIQKWRERSQGTIDGAMIDPSDLEDIVNGRKGIPPLANFSMEDDWFGAKGNYQSFEERRSTLKDESDEYVVYGDENLPGPSHSESVIHRPPPAPSAHEKACRKLECLLESKKHAYTHPLDGSSAPAKNSPPNTSGTIKRPLSIHSGPYYVQHQPRLHCVGGVAHQKPARPAPYASNMTGSHFSRVLEVKKEAL